MDPESTPFTRTARPGGGAGQVDVQWVSRWLREFARVVIRDAAELTRLDAAIGDADHGANMERGVRAVVAALDAEPVAGTTPTPTPAELLKSVGMTLVSTVGGASGPLYGTFFLRMSAAAGSAADVDAAQLATALRAGLEGIVQRGKAEAGEKTMFDALAPACAALDAALADSASLTAALADAADAAERGRDATVPMLARKGRASYLGERSVGHPDPGATSAALLVRAAADTTAE